MFEFLIAVLIAVLPTCASESDAWCYWDASAQGNGAGSSFIATGSHVYYTGVAA